MNCPAGTPNGVEAIDQMTASQLLSLAAERMGDEEREELVGRMNRIAYDLEPQWTHHVGLGERRPKSFEECYGHGPTEGEDAETMRAVLAALLPGEPRD